MVTDEDKYPHQGRLFKKRNQQTPSPTSFPNHPGQVLFPSNPEDLLRRPPHSSHFLRFRLSSGASRAETKAAPFTPLCEERKKQAKLALLTDAPGAPRKKRAKLALLTDAPGAPTVVVCSTAFHFQ
uniref:Uncharacterized protein n=1 Tax=Steinernema glaseri TaxID=37863 RepID=A0A1I7YTJ2_9BILA